MNDTGSLPVGMEAHGNRMIAALRPSDCFLEIEVFSEWDGAVLQCSIRERDTGVPAFSGTVTVKDRVFSVPRLYNYVEYLLKLSAPTGEQESRPFRCGYLPGRVVAYNHPDDRTHFSSASFLGSPSLVRLPDGGLLAGMDHFSPDGSLDTSEFYRSDDEGNTWRFCSRVSPAFWGKLFLHKGRLFYLCVAGSYEPLVIYESKDSGRTWTGPVRLLDKIPGKPGGPHRAPGPLAVCAGRVWAAVEYGSWATGGHEAGAMSFPKDGDPMDPAQWTCTGFTPYDPNWPGTSVGDNEKYLEGNMVAAPDGRLIDFLRYQCRKATPSHGRAILLEADPRAPGNSLRFYQVVDFPGNASKFSIQWDPVSRQYWALCSRIVTDVLEQRNLLSLIASPDLIHWTLRRDILNYNDNGWWEDEHFVGFQYPDWIFQGEDILFLSRTAVNRAVRYHDSNYITFHRIRNFRR